MLADGANGAFIAWTDLRTTLDYDIYSSKLFAGDALPLRLLSFVAGANNRDVTLSWSTENEINCSHFELQFSTDGTTFKELGAVKATNLPNNNKYSFLHAGVTNNLLYYRLKLVDNDNSVAYSAIVKVNLNSQIAIALYPNPAAAILQVKNINPVTDDIVQVISNDGKLLIQQKAVTNMQVKINQLNAGVYLVRLIKKDKTMQSFSFIKQ